MSPRKLAILLLLPYLAYDLTSILVKMVTFQDSYLLNHCSFLYDVKDKVVEIHSSFNFHDLTIP